MPESRIGFLTSKSDDPKNGSNCKMLCWTDLIQMSNEELDKLDVAVVHLTCAVGLPGAETLDISECSAKLDNFAERVAEYTESLRPRYEANRDRFQYSPEMFRMFPLIWTLERELNLQVDERINERRDKRDCSHWFLHGLLTGTRLGNCATIPVLYVAVGRRLGYPLKFSTTACHLFARWEDANGTRFNIECTPRGLNTPPDEYYLSWPKKITPADVEEGCFLETCSPRDELAGFLVQRAYCLYQNGRRREGIEALVAASHLQPRRKLHFADARRFLSNWKTDLTSSLPPSFPKIVVHPSPARRFPDDIPNAFEHDLIRTSATEEILNDPHHIPWWKRLRSAPFKAHCDIPTSIQYSAVEAPLFQEACV